MINSFLHPTSKLLLIFIFCSTFFLGFSGFNLPAQADEITESRNLPDFLEDSKFSGNLRNYWQFRNFNELPASSGTSIGGMITFQSGEFFGGFSIGASYIYAQGYGLNNDNLPLGDGSIETSEISLLGEGYLRYENFDTVFKAGRLLIDTPYANRAEGFMTPISFTGMSITNQTLPNLKTTLFHFYELKNRRSDEFINAGEFATGRIAGTPEKTFGVTTLGLEWTQENIKTQFWNYYMYDMMNLAYFEAEYTVNSGGDFSPVMGFQYIREDAVDDKLLGNVESNTFGMRVGFGSASTLVTLAANYTPINTSKFRSGGYQAPWTLNTDPLYTNMMLEGLQVKPSADVGFAFKILVAHQFNDQVMVRLSFAGYDLPETVGGNDSSEWNAEVFYKFKGWLEGFEIRNQMGHVDSSTPGRDLFEHRLQLQYNFEFNAF